MLRLRRNVTPEVRKSSMKKFHVNPETGEPGRCRATEGYCPFGDADQHFSSADEARNAYEAQMADYEDYRESPLGKLDSIAGKAVTKLRSAITRAVDWMDDHPKIVIGGVAVIAAAAAAVVAYKIASTNFRPLSSNPVQGIVTDGNTKSRVVGIIGKGGHVDLDTVYKVELPDGSITEYTSGHSSILPDGSTVDVHLWSDGTVHDTAPMNGAVVNGAWAVAGGTIGASGGLVTAFLARMGIDRMGEWMDAHWNMRHEERFGLLSWRTA